MQTMCPSPSTSTEANEYVLLFRKTYADKRKLLQETRNHQDLRQGFPGRDKFHSTCHDDRLTLRFLQGCTETMLATRKHPDDSHPEPRPHGLCYVPANPLRAVRDLAESLIKNRTKLNRGLPHEWLDTYQDVGLR